MKYLTIILLALAFVSCQRDIDEPIYHLDEIEEGVFCATILPSEDGMEEMEKRMAAQPKSDVMYYCPTVIHVLTDPNGINKGHVPLPRLISGMQTLRDAFRGEGKHAGISPDTNIEIVPIGYNYVDAYALWGETYRQHGVRFDGSLGVTAIQLQVLKQGYPEGTEHIYLSTKISYTGTGVIAGMASFGVGANNAVNVVVNSRWGDRHYHGEQVFISPLKPSTIIHEQAHRYALYHTFHNTASCAAETNPLLQGDKLECTPPVTLTYGCISCGIEDDSWPSYSNCRNTFKDCQVDRMRANISAWASEWVNGEAYDWNSIPFVIEPLQWGIGFAKANWLHYGADSVEMYVGISKEIPLQAYKFNITNGCMEWSSAFNQPIFSEVPRLYAFRYKRDGVWQWHNKGFRYNEQGVMLNMPVPNLDNQTIIIL